MSPAYAVELHNDHNQPGDHIAVWAFPKLCLDGLAGDKQDSLGVKVDVWLVAFQGNRRLTIKMKNDFDQTCLLHLEDCQWFDIY